MGHINALIDYRALTGATGQRPLVLQGHAGTRSPRLLSRGRGKR